MSFQMSVSPTTPTIGVCVASTVGVGVLPAAGGVETLVVVAVVPQAMSPANRMSARRMAIDLRCWLMGFFPFLSALLDADTENIAFFVLEGVFVKRTFRHAVRLHQKIEIFGADVCTLAIGIDDFKCLG